VKPNGPDSSSEDLRAQSHADGLLRTSDVFLCFEDVPQTLEALFVALGSAVPVRALVVVEPDPENTGAVMAHSVGADARERDLRRLEQHARATFAYLVELEDSLVDNASGKELAFPLVSSAGAIAGLLLVVEHETPSDADLAFLGAVAAQFSSALSRGRPLDSSMSGARVVEAPHVTFRRLSFNADLLAILNAVPDPSRELPRLARLALHRIADGCVLELAEASTRQRTVAARLPDAVVEAAARRLVPRVLVTRQRLVACRASRPPATTAHAGWSADSEAEALCRELALDWISCVPIESAERGDVIGAAMLFAIAPNGPALDQTAVEALGQSLGAAIERARTYRAALFAAERYDHALSVVAHDLKQPLSAMLLNVSALVGRAPAEQERRRTGRKQLEAIQRGIARLRRLTDDLLDVAGLTGRGIRIQCASFALPGLVAETSELFEATAAARGITLRTAVSSELPPVWCDGGRILQVLTNLVGNALKFTPTGGTITISALPTRDAVTLSVRDTGIGIRASDRASIFERFWQAEEAESLGTGIGLWIVKAIVEAHGSHVDVESEEGRGTTFAFSLPVAGNVAERRARAREG
jgi:signal transduction histidine kinase